MFSSKNVWIKVAYFNINLHACLSKFLTIYNNHINKKQDMWMQKQTRTYTRKPVIQFSLFILEVSDLRSRAK